jgi:hypothetical protein
LPLLGALDLAEPRDGEVDHLLGPLPPPGERAAEEHELHEHEERVRRERPVDPGVARASDPAPRDVPVVGEEQPELTHLGGRLPLALEGEARDALALARGQIRDEQEPLAVEGLRVVEELGELVVVLGDGDAVEPLGLGLDLLAERADLVRLEAEGREPVLPRAWRDAATFPPEPCLEHVPSLPEHVAELVVSGVGLFARGLRPLLSRLARAPLRLEADLPSAARPLTLLCQPVPRSDLLSRDVEEPRELLRDGALGLGRGLSRPREGPLPLLFGLACAALGLGLLRHRRPLPLTVRLDEPRALRLREHEEREACAIELDVGLEEAVRGSLHPGSVDGRVGDLSRDLARPRGRRRVRRRSANEELEARALHADTRLVREIEAEERVRFHRQGERAAHERAHLGGLDHRRAHLEGGVSPRVGGVRYAPLAIASVRRSSETSCVHLREGDGGHGEEPERDGEGQ